jgi:hypothetical protein
MVLHGRGCGPTFLSIRHNGAQLTAAIAMPEKPWGSESVCNNQTAVAALSQTANTSSYHGVGSGTFLPMQDASCLAARVAARRVFGSMTRPALLVTIAWRWTDDCGCC